jgi:hypothetical protein
MRLPDQGGGFGELLLGDLETVGPRGGDVPAGVAEHFLESAGGGDEQQVGAFGGDAVAVRKVAE